MASVDANSVSAPVLPGMEESKILPHHQSAGSSSAHPEWKYDVFVSFRGKDTRRGFMSHLFSTFELKYIRCYIDTQGDQRGLAVGPMLLDAIRGSRVVLVLFSARYADSKWCLDELVEIMDCANEAYHNSNRMVVPVFYNVEPTDVRNQTGRFGEGFNESCTAKNVDAKAVIKWRQALKWAGNLSGWHLQNDANGDEAKLIREIVDQISSQTSFLNSPYFIRDAVGIDKNAEDVISLLEMESDNVRMIGLFGIKGIGKTTLAGLVCSRIFWKFDGVSFLENIGDRKQGSLVDLQKKLIHDVLKMKVALNECDPTQNVNEIKDKLGHMKILLVLDGVRDSSHQVILLGGRKGSLGRGSKILITTEAEQLLDNIKVHGRHMVSGYGSRKSSLQLFNRYAFGVNDPEDGFEELCENVVHYAGGFPLAIKTLGRCLFGETKDQWSKLLVKLVQNPNLDWSRPYSENPGSFLLPYSSKVGLYRSSCSCFYDDKASTSIRWMKIGVSESGIVSIHIDYDQNGSLVSCRHGGPNESITHEVKLKYPDEYLTSISGHVTKNTDNRMIQSLTLISNYEQYGPYGVEKGNRFSICEQGKIVGFFGDCGPPMRSIGAYYAPVSNPYPFKTIGPFGHKGGTIWDDGKHSGVRQIDVISNSVVEFISFTYDKYGYSTIPFSHGESKSTAKTVVLDYLYEYLTSISGYLRDNNGELILQSLCFHSNRRTFGPFGEEIGMPFSGPSTGGEIVGFYGTCTSGSIQSIGAYLEPVSHIHPVRSIGPFGGYDGNQWDDGKDNDLLKIIAKSGSFIHSIRCIYHNSIEQAERGGASDADVYTVELDYPNEYIIFISGYFGQKDDFTVIKSLTFRSNKRVYGPYGVTEGAYFESPPQIGKLVGFYGRISDAYLNSIGAYFAPVLHKIDLIKTIGPCGGQGGNLWDDGRHMNLRKIYLSYGEVIDGICCEYEEIGQFLSAPMHGGKGRNEKMIELQCPNEYLISVSGYTGLYRNQLVVKSLTFRSNAKIYGPFGIEEGTPFSLRWGKGKIIGFFGRSGLCLYSLGAYHGLLPNNFAIGASPPPTYGIGGPHGSEDGEAWDDGRHINLRKIYISYGQVIHGIQCDYEEDGKLVRAMMHGGHGEKHSTIVLDYPTEYLIYVSGFTGTFSGSKVISGLRFQSNKNSYGPFGGEGNKAFVFGSKEGIKIHGFFGQSSGTYLHLIGAYIGLVANNSTSEACCAPALHISRPYGAQVGEVWDDGRHINLRKLSIYYGEGIDGIRCKYGKSGKSVLATKHGPGGSINSSMIGLRDPSEYLTSISGCVGEISGKEIVKSLKFRTNKQPFGPFGGKGGTPFSFEARKGKIVGFYGRSDKYLETIGAHVSPLPNSVIVGACCATAFNIVGPYGGQDGQPWDDGRRMNLRKIVVYYGEVVNGIRCDYDENGRSVSASMHGAEGEKSFMIELHPEEYLTSVSGYSGEFNNREVITLLIFETNKGNFFGPFGTKGETPFAFTCSSGKIVGFFGRSGSQWLHSLGAHLEFFQSD